eukprot:m51a1_g10279 hypothetical protein (218) ;mRNA; r:79516-80563
MQAAGSSVPQSYEGKDPVHHLPRTALVERVLDLAFHRRIVLAVYVASPNLQQARQGDASAAATALSWDRWLWSCAAAAERVLYLVDQGDTACSDPEHLLWRAIKTMLGDRASKAHVICATVYGRCGIRPSYSSFVWGAELGPADMLFSREDCCALSRLLGFAELRYDAPSGPDRLRTRPESLLVSHGCASAMAGLRLFDVLSDLSGQPKVAWPSDRL